MLPGPTFPFVITVLGVPLTINTYDIMELVVDLRNDMPGMCTIRLQDRRQLPKEAPSFLYTDLTPNFVVGAPVTVSAVNVEPSVVPAIPMPIFIGEITALETEFSESGEVNLTIRAYHKTHRLQRGRKTKVFQMMPDNLIVMAVAGAAGVPMTAVPTGGPNEYVLQNNQTDWEFIQERANRIGYAIQATPLGTFNFGPKGVPSGTPALLAYRAAKSNLFSFTARVSAYGQVSAVEIDVLDPKLGTPVPVPAIAPVPPTPLGGNTAKIALDYAGAMTFGAVAKQFIEDQPHENIATATAQAIAVSKSKVMDFVHAEGETYGNPSLRPGSPIAVQAGIKYSGPYILTSVTHYYSPEVGYRTRFAVSGSEPETITGLLEGGGSGPKRVNGVVVGIVTNNIDPLQLGRVKVRYPHLGNLPPIESNWCRIAAPAGGIMSGAYFIPDINTEVLVAFERGDVNFPYIVGTLWNNLSRPPKPSAAVVIGGKVVERIIQTPMGLKITMSDMPGKMGIEISDKVGLNSIALDAVKGAIAIKALTDVTIDSLNFKVNSKALLDMVSLGKASIKGTALLNLESGGIAKVKSATMLSLEGSAVTVKANTMLKMDGLKVNINNGALEIM
jgi:hypothetical protein